MLRRNSVSRSLIAALALFLALPTARAEEAKRPFKNESEAGVVLTGGNSDSRSFNFKQMNAYEVEGNVFKFNGRYLGASSRGVESARSWSLGLRYEREIHERLSAFVAETIESDIFAGYLQRYNTDVGGKYLIVKSEDLTWSTELGYRFASENRLVGAKVESHYARVYTEAEKAWNKSFSTKLWVEGLPNFSDSTDYQVNGELSLSAVLTSILSLKTAYLVKYDHLPAPGVVERADTQLTTALVAKF